MFLTFLTESQYHRITGLPSPRGHRGPPRGTDRADYLVNLYAKRKDRRMGQIVTRGKAGGMGLDYRFRSELYEVRGLR